MSSGRPLEGVVRHVVPGRVLLDHDGEPVTAQIRGLLKDGPRAGRRRSAHVLAVGDRVRFSIRGERDAVVDEVLPRRNRISRGDPGDPKRELVVAANLDLLLAMVSLERPRFNARALDRLLVLGEAAEIPCAVILNKTDLSGEVAPSECVEPYTAAGYPVHRISALTGDGCEELHAVIAGRMSLLLGPSGVGKSTLLNRLAGVSLKTSPVSDATQKGVHTTTGVEWVPLPQGGVVLDSPGIRSIHPYNLTAANLADCFPEFRDLAACQYGDCLHRGEPGCAVASAAAGGRVAPSRYDSYLRLLAGMDDV